MHEQEKQARFAQAILPHLGAAYRLARWLTRNNHDAEDVTQEAYLRAYRLFDRFRGDNGRAWLLAVVRNTCYTWLKHHRAHELTTSFDEQTHGTGSDAMNPERLFLQKVNGEILRAALEELPVIYREVLILRELEDFSYKEIAAISAIPLGTVMSRLTRARCQLQQVLSRRLTPEVLDDL